MTTMMKAISLFSGAGGMDVGFTKAGFNVIWANDISPDACQTYRLNHGHKIYEEDLRAELPNLRKLVKKERIDCLFGGPPCQGFSVAGKMNIDDPRSQLVLTFMECVKITKPRSFVMENVKSLATLKKFVAIREKLIKIAEHIGYDVDIVVLNSCDYGVPQLRERMFFVGTKDIKNKFREEIKKTTNQAKPLRHLFQSLGRVGSPKNNRTCKAKITFSKSPVLRKSPYAGMLFNGQGRPLRLDGYSATLPASMGGNRTPIVDDGTLYENQEPWVIQYHRKLLEGAIPCQQKQAPKRLRRLTIDEAAAIQGFPKCYKFYGSQSSVYSQIGNAVPCKLANAAARAIYSILDK